MLICLRYWSLKNQKRFEKYIERAHNRFKHLNNVWIGKIWYSLCTFSVYPMYFYYLFSKRMKCSFTYYVFITNRISTNEKRMNMSSVENSQRETRSYIRLISDMYFLCVYFVCLLFILKKMFFCGLFSQQTCWTNAKRKYLYTYQGSPCMPLTACLQVQLQINCMCRIWKL